MHKKIIHKKNIFLIMILLNLIFIINGSNAEDCQNFNKKMEEARAYFPLYNEIELNYSLRNSFITNYNKVSKDENILEADKVILLTLLDRNEWYVFAAIKNCLVFWVNLEPDRFIELIDGGALAKDQGLWRND